jgi:tRNA A-37 threonylcarbamoyl transferase component Bud32
MIEITRDNIGDYLLANGLIDSGEEVSIEPIGGFWGGMGVSSTLIRVMRARDSFVLKQPLAELAVKEYWPCETDRIRKERDCIEALAGIIGDDLVPKVMFFDEANDVLVLELIPPDWQLWKTQLLAGVLDERVPRAAGEVIASIHNKTYKSEAIEQKFCDLSVFTQLRIDPYYKTTAARNPDVAALIELELQRVLDSRVCLVLGDFSPKNIFTKDGRVILLDHEIAHYGEPTVDFAFCLNHLLLKFMHFSLERGKMEETYLDVARIYCDAYFENVRFSDKETIDRVSVPSLGCFMLARIDGKSPVEYITSDETRRVVRTISKKILSDGYNGMAEVFDLVQAELLAAIKQAS